MAEPDDKWAGLRRVVESMRSADDEGDGWDASWRVDGKTCDNALEWLALVEAAQMPAPKIFCHGGDAIVLTWGETPGDTHEVVYITITGKHAYPLVPSRRKLRQQTRILAQETAETQANSSD